MAPAVLVATDSFRFIIHFLIVSFHYCPQSGSNRTQNRFLLYPLHYIKSSKLYYPYFSKYFSFSHGSYRSIVNYIVDPHEQDDLFVLRVVIVCDRERSAANLRL